MPWAAVAAVAAVAATGVEVYGQIEQGKANARAANYSAQVSRNNATIADQNAAYATQAGSEAATAESLKGGARIARIKTAQAANGLDVNSGSAVDVRAGQAETNKLDTLTTQHNALLQAYGYKTQATGDTAQAGLYQQQANEAPTAAGLGAAGTLLGNASSLGFRWAQMQGGGAAPSGG